MSLCLARTTGDSIRPSAWRLYGVAIFVACAAGCGGSDNVDHGHSRNDDADETMVTQGNRLRDEKSPYLLQHAGNPVDWHPWGEEAFARANELDRPIFLSVGYATCHWCHVMEEESFEDSAVADLLNAHFVAIKVDREERPDIDEIYMNVCQMMTGSGGWPLTVIMAPDGRPFFAGTYIPKEPRYGRMGLLDLLNLIEEKWRTERASLSELGERVTSALRQAGAGSDGVIPSLGTLEAAVLTMRSQYDARFGGYGGAPKFPMPHRLTAMTRWVHRTGDATVLGQLEHSLRAMRWGGIYDQLGYGFHRYSTDPQWLVPHFEKMLYDNAGLAITYTEMYQLTGNDEWRAVAEEIFTYVLRDMTSPDGAFYSAEDADSEGEEGTFYVWEPDGFDQPLGPDRGNLARRFWGVTATGNFEGGRAILHQVMSPDVLAEAVNRPVDEVRRDIDDARRRLFELRQQREHPFKDDKVLMSWNGFMIAALAKASQAFDQPRYADAAAQAARFVLETLRDDRGRLLRRYRDGSAGIPAFSEDYAYLVWGLIELYEATFDARYLQEALALNDEMLRLFWDDADGGLHFTGIDSEELLVRPKEYGDGAMPSANSVAALNLLRLGRMTGNTGLEARADAMLRSFGSRFAQSPTNYMQAWWALDFAHGPSYEIVLAADNPDAIHSDIAQAIRSRYLPRKVLMARFGDNPPVAKLAPYLAAMKPVNGQPTVYVCRNYQCELPVTSTDALNRLLAEQAPTRLP